MLSQQRLSLRRRPLKNAQRHDKTITDKEDHTPDKKSQRKPLKTNPEAAPTKAPKEIRADKTNKNYKSYKSKIAKIAKIARIAI